MSLKKLLSQELYRGLLSANISELADLTQACEDPNEYFTLKVDSENALECF